MRAHDRAGRVVQQLEGYSAFEPHPLPPEPPLDFTGRLSRGLAEASHELGRLDATASALPDVELFIAMYTRQEALLSSIIEGTECTLDDVIASELNPDDLLDLNVTDVVNHVAALEHGIRRLSELPLSGRLIRETHAVLLRSGRGSEKSPGEFRRTQNWIGRPGCSLSEAAFIPPAVDAMHASFADLERFLHESDLPDLIIAGLAHAQFETIHPFLDGNGRVGRLLVSLYLHEQGLLSKPVLSLSSFLRRHQSEYVDRLMRVRSHGEWEQWLEFFLRGVAEAAKDATGTAARIHGLRESDRQRTIDAGGTARDLALVDLLYRQPIVTARWVESEMGVVPATANKLLARLEAIGVLREVTGFRRNRRFRYDSYIDIFGTPN